MFGPGLDSAETVKRLLVFGRNQAEGPMEHVDVTRLLDEVAELTAPRWRDTTHAEGRPVSLEVHGQEGLLIDGRPGALREALTNLIFNAVDALPGGGAIALTARRVDR